TWSWGEFSTSKGRGKSFISCGPLCAPVQVLVVDDTAGLFEVLAPAEFDVVVLVDAPVALRRTRLRAMRGLANDEADRMIAAQMPAERKRGRSHYVIDNDGTLEQLEVDARRLYEALAARAK